LQCLASTSCAVRTLMTPATGCSPSALSCPRTLPRFSFPSAACRHPAVPDPALAALLVRSSLQHGPLGARLDVVLTRSPRATAAGDAAPAAPLNAVRSRGSQPLARNVKMPLIDPDRFKVGRSHSTNGQRHGTLRHNALAGDPSRRRPEPAARLPASADSAPPRRPSPPSSLPRLPVIGDSRKRAEKDSATRVAPKAKQAVQQLPRVANGTGRPRA